MANNDVLAVKWDFQYETIFSMIQGLTNEDEDPFSDVCVRYACDRCSYKATDKSTLRRHQKSKHEGVRYECNQCEYTTGWKGDISKHKQSKHQNLL